MKQLRDQRKCLLKKIKDSQRSGTSAADVFKLNSGGSIWWVSWIMISIDELQRTICHKYRYAKLNVDGLPRPVKRARGDNRAKLTADDLLDLYMCLDEKGCLDRLPTHVARNLERVPSVKLEDMELYCVSQKLESLDKRLSAVESVNAKLDRVSE